MKILDDKSVAKRDIYNKWLGESIATMYVVGIWPQSNSSIFYRTYGYATVFIFLFNFLLMLVKVFQLLNDIDKLISHFNVIVFNHLAISKTFLLLKSRYALERLCEELENTYTKMEVKMKDPISSVISKRMRRFNIATISLVGLSGTNWTMMSIVTWIFFPNTTRNDLNTFNMTQTRDLSYNLYLPFDWTLSPAYEIVLTIQTVIMGMVYYLNISVDSFYFTLMSHASGQLQALTKLLLDLKENSLTSIRESSQITQKLRNKMTHSEAILLESYKNSWNMPNIIEDEEFMFNSGPRDDTTTKLNELIVGDTELDQDMTKSLHECVKFHCKITRFSKDVEDIMVLPMIVEFSGLTAMICLQMFETVTKEKTFDNTFKFVNTAIVAISVLFMYCRFGHEIKTWSNKVEEAVYGIEWYERSQEFKRTCLFILLRGQKSIIFRCGPFYDVTLQTFIKVIQTAYSYFTLMIQVNKRK